MLWNFLSLSLSPSLFSSWMDRQFAAGNLTPQHPLNCNACLITSSTFRLFVLRFIMSISSWIYECLQRVFERGRVRLLHWCLLVCLAAWLDEWLSVCLCGWVPECMDKIKISFKEFKCNSNNNSNNNTLNYGKKKWDRKKRKENLFKIFS